MKEIAKYILVVFIFISVFWGGYFVFFYMVGHPIEEKDVIIKIVNSKNKTAISQNQKQILRLTDILKQIKTQQTKRSQQIQHYKRENYLTVSTLNAFYASLFTAIAVIAGIIGLGAWKTVNSLREKLEKLNKIEDKVDFLHKKKDYAEWIRKLFEDNNNNDIASAKLSLNHNERNKLQKIREYLENEIRNDSWLMIVLAKELSETNKNEESINILKFIEKRDLLDEQIKPVLYHLKAQMFWCQYENYNKKEFLDKSIECYKKALVIDKKRDETLGNLAVVEIEYAEKKSEDKEKYLKNALEHLDKVKKLKKDTFNTYFDMARAKYLLNKICKEGVSDNNEQVPITEEIEELLFKAAEKIKTIKSRDVFFEYLNAKDICFADADNWKTKIKNEVKKRVEEKQWLK